ncbi:hypothetical protein BH09VER1_BH09VER1_19950 [soil metagenome]
MDPLPPIPTSPAVRTREFRSRLLPKLVFGVVLLVIVLLWLLYISAPVLVGQVEPITTFVNSPKAGILKELNLVRLQQVKAGDQVAVVATNDPKVVQTSLAVIQSEIELLKVNMEPEMAEQRYAIQFDRLRLDAMSQRVELASSRVKLQQAENDLRRAATLAKTKIVSDSVLEQTQATRDKLMADVQERTKLVNEMEKSINSHQVGEGASEKAPGPEEILKASIAVQEAKLALTEAELKPIVLYAPIDGVVSVITRRPGETITPGEPIATITALTSDHILGYIRQPIAVRVAAGMNVEIQARSFNRPIGKGTIVHVGTQLEPINPVLLLSSSSSSTPVLGLPLEISLPPGLKLVPGEIVDLALR